MRPLEFLSSAFINFFGITQPTPKQERMAAYFIIGLLLFTFSVLAAIAVLLFFSIRP